MSATEPNTTGSRGAAIGALLLAAIAAAVGLIGLIGDVWRLLVVPAVLLLVAMSGWVAVTRRGVLRVAALVLTAAWLMVVVTIVVTAQGHGLLLIVVVVLLACSTAMARRALGKDPGSLKAAPTPGTPVPAASKPALIMNLKSGGGKAEQFHLEDECAQRGIEAIVLRPGDDLLELARRAIERGADVIGMAGGDGSQALVATVAMAHDVPLVCIPAGTRNHFALDLGLDRDDVVGALDAFGEASERRIDLAQVTDGSGDRVFVNNVSLGVYAKVVQSPDYRDAKRQTTANMLPDLLGPDAEPFDLHLAKPDGTTIDGAQVIQISNNAYVLTRLGGFGTRARLDTGNLGVAAAKIDTAKDVAALVAAETTGHVDRFAGWEEWEAPTVTVTSGAPVEAGVDGEAMVLEAPLEFRSLPGALRVRIPHDAPGVSPAAVRPSSPWWTVAELFRLAAGK
ncbi:MAG: diacylglycerol kinase family protein [Acidimicrobiales bacterium]